MQLDFQRQVLRQLPILRIGQQEQGELLEMTLAQVPDQTKRRRAFSPVLPSPFSDPHSLEQFTASLSQAQREDLVRTIIVLGADMHAHLHSCASPT